MCTLIVRSLCILAALITSACDVDLAGLRASTFDGGIQDRRDADQRGTGGQNAVQGAGGQSSVRDTGGNAVGTGGSSAGSGGASGGTSGAGGVLGTGGSTYERTIELNGAGAGSSPFKGFDTIQNPAASEGRYIEFLVDTVDAWVDLSLRSIYKPGTFNVTLYYTSSNKYGSVRVQIDGVDQGGTCDQYSETTQYQVACALGQKTFPTTNTYTLRLIVAGKNPASTGYQINVDKIVLTAP